MGKRIFISHFVPSRDINGKNSLPVFHLKTPKPKTAKRE
jgi:hypothetical protein